MYIHVICCLEGDTKSIHGSDGDIDPLRAMSWKPKHHLLVKYSALVTTAHWVKDINLTNYKHIRQWVYFDMALTTHLVGGLGLN